MWASLDPGDLGSGATVALCCLELGQCPGLARLLRRPGHGPLPGFSSWRCFRDVCPNVLTHRVQLAGKRGDCAEARLLAQRNAGPFRLIEPFLDDLPGRVLIGRGMGGQWLLQSF